MSFEEYIPQRSSPRASSVTINKLGLMSFNVSAVNEYIKNNQYAKLYYDSHTRRVGIKFLLEKEVNCLSVTKGKPSQRNNAILSLKSFLNIYKILPHNKSLKGLPCKMDLVLDMLIIQLPDSID